jgi:DNA-binding transcriptional LysR family regulator
VAAAVAGIGITVCARWLIADEVANGRLVQVLDDWQFEHSGGIHLVRPSSRYTPLKTRVFADWLIERFATPPWGA